jgi:hypothetical protein
VLGPSAAGADLRSRVRAARGACGEAPRRLGEAVEAAFAQRADERRADDRAVGVLEHTAHLFGVRDADADARVLDAVVAQAGHQRARGGVQLRPLPRDAHRRDRVDEAGGVAHDEVEPLVGRRRGGEEDAVQARALARGDPFRRGLRSDVGGDESGTAGGEEIVGVAVDAVLQHGIPVGHHEHRHVDPTRDLTDGREGVAQPEAPGQGCLRRFLDDGAVHHGIGVGRPEFDDVGAVLGQRDSSIDARPQVGESDREIADEGAASFGVGGVDRRGDW